MGNPYYGDDGTVPAYMSWFRADIIAEMSASKPRQPGHPWCEHFWRMSREIGELRGKNLACWCKPGKPCHADVLLEIANAEPAHV